MHPTQKYQWRQQGFLPSDQISTRSAADLSLALHPVPNQSYIVPISPQPGTAPVYYEAWRRDRGKKLLQKPDQVLMTCWKFFSTHTHQGLLIPTANHNPSIFSISALLTHCLITGLMRKSSRCLKEYFLHTCTVPFIYYALKCTRIKAPHYYRPCVLNHLKSAQRQKERDCSKLISKSCWPQCKKATFPATQYVSHSDIKGDWSMDSLLEQIFILNQLLEINDGSQNLSGGR